MLHIFPLFPRRLEVKVTVVLETTLQGTRVRLDGTLIGDAMGVVVKHVVLTLQRLADDGVVAVDARAFLSLVHDRHLLLLASAFLLGSSRTVLQVGMATRGPSWLPLLLLSIIVG